MQLFIGTQIKGHQHTNHIGFAQIFLFTQKQAFPHTKRPGYPCVARIYIHPMRRILRNIALIFIRISICPHLNLFSKRT